MAEKNTEKRRTAFQAALSAALGVTEPALFGVNLSLMRSMISACIAGAVGGAMVGAAGTHCNSFAFPSFITSVILLYGFGVKLQLFPTVGLNEWKAYIMPVTALAAFSESLDENLRTSLL